MYQLLIVDDDKEVLALNHSSFEDAGFSVRCATSAKECFQILSAFSPDCILLDVMMPGMNGFEVCKKIREMSSVPIIFLTGRVSEDDKINGLLLGADDYIEKPYSFRELEARVRANIRRNSDVHSEELSFPPLRIDIRAHQAFCGEINLNVSPQEYDLLHMLATSGGRIVTYEEIGNWIWGTYMESDRQAIMVAVSRLRKKLEANPVTARMIETVWTKGYRFTGKKGENRR